MMGQSNMELALARLVGSGLTIVYEGFEHPAPEGAVENGLELIRVIARERPDVAMTLMQGVVRDIWAEWRQSKLPDTLAVTHIEALPAIMERCRAEDGLMLGAVAAIQVTRRMGAAARHVNHSSRIASSIVSRAIETGLVGEHGLNQSIAFFFLDRLLAKLMHDQQLFLDLRPLYAAYLASKVWRPADSAQAEVLPEPEAAPDDAVASGVADEAAARDFTAPDDGHDAAPALVPAGDPIDSEAQAAEPVPAGPMELVAALEAAFTASAGVHAPVAAAAGSDDRSPAHKPEADAAPTPVEHAAAQHGVPLPVLQHFIEKCALRHAAHGGNALDDVAFGLRQILDRLRQPACSNPAAANRYREAARLLEVCDVAGADQALGQAEDCDLQAAPGDLPNANQHLADAAKSREIRALIEELAGDFRRAARHYAQCVRCLPESDRNARRGYLMRQAGALAAQGELAGETAALAEAAQVYAAAGRLLSEQDAPLEWACAHLELGRVLMELGEREGRPERYLAAALHFKPASDVFSHLKQFDSWAMAQLGLADALRAQGEVQGDIVTLNEAAFSYRAALGIAARDRMPTEWAVANYRLALTLLRIDTESGGIEHHEDAAMALRAVAAADTVSPAIRCNARARLARALLTIARTRGEGWHEAEALSLIEECRTGAREQLADNARAAMQDELGGLLAAIGEARSSSDLIGEACALKASALEHFQSAGDRGAAQRLRGELSLMQTALQGLSGSVVAAA